MTFLTRIPGTPDPTLLPPVPDLGITDLTHFYHPRACAGGAAKWVDAVDSVGAKDLAVSGDATITMLTEGSPHPRSYLKLTTGASFLSGAIFAPAEIGSLFAVVRIAPADGRVNTGYLIHNGASGINMPTTGSPSVSLTNGAGSTTCALDVWHLVSITATYNAGTANYTPRFTIDGNTFTGTNTATAPTHVRVGSNGVGNHKALSVAGVFTTASAIPAATITGDLLPAVRDWWEDLMWPA